MLKQWFEKRKAIRRNDDMKEKLSKAIEEKHQASIDALKRLNQFTLDKRKPQHYQYIGPERRSSSV